MRSPLVEPSETETPAIELVEVAKHYGATRVVEDISLDGPDRSDKKVRIDGPYVKQRLKDILQKEDLTRFIL